MRETLEMLARHHRDGEAFAELMRESFAGRFDGEFWDAWERLVEPLLPPKPTLLDLGSGPGLLLRELVRRYPGARALGVECAPYMLDAAGELPEGCEVFVEDLHDPRIPLADGSVDAAVASMVLHEMVQPLRALQEVRRCLKKGGALVILDWVRVPLAQYLVSENKEQIAFGPATSTAELEDLFVHFIEHNRFTRADLAYLLEMSGFEIEADTPLRDGAHVRLIAIKR